MREQFKSEIRGDFIHGCLTEYDLFQELCFYSGCRGSPWQGIVNEEIQRISTMWVVGVFDLLNDLAEQLGPINGFGVKALAFSFFYLFDIIFIHTHKSIFFIVHNWQERVKW